MGGAYAPHPVPGLMDAAETRFRAKLARQSTTLAAAREFSAWYAFTVQHAFVIIDEFDAVVEDLAPFWELSGEEVRGMAGLVGALPSIDLVRVRGGEAEMVRAVDGDSAVSAWAEGLMAMLAKFVKELSVPCIQSPPPTFQQQILSPHLIILQKLANASPQLDFPFNAKEEGRVVVVPWEHIAYPNYAQVDRVPVVVRHSGELRGDSHERDMADHDIFSTLTMRLSPSRGRSP
ncbi:hypothetical protein B0H13DRAFT_2378938 [Mycena leptocephala]|nr:hypothetical protein B0H13DRAFT_2378938 [Mycena leptocephala]